MEPTSRSLYDHQRLEATDVQLVESVKNQENWDCEYRQLTPGSYRGEITAAGFNETIVLKERHSQSVIVSGSGPVDDYLFCISPDKPAARRFQGKQPGELDLILLQPGAVVDYVFESNTDLAYVQLPRLQTRLICMAAGIDVRQLDQHVLRADPLARQRLVQAMYLALEPILSTDPALVRARSVTTEQRVLGALADVLSTVGSSNVSSDRLKGANATPALARRVRDCMDASLDEPLQMIDLCGELHCKLRTLHYAFTSYFGVPPSAYHKKTRMNSARRALLDADPDATTVTNIATQYGFWHLGRFSVDYKRMFGELPSQTLATNKPQFKYTSVRQASDWPDHFGPRA